MSKEYNIVRPSGRCVKCQAVLTPGQEFVATLRELNEDFQREDFCLACWQLAGEAVAASKKTVGVWRARVQQGEAKKRLFVDNDVLVGFFERLEAATEPARINFRFVLALVLMRKKLLAYDGMTRQADGQETWKMHLKGTEKAFQVLDPKMDETKIAEVSGHLGEILEGEL